MSALHVAVRHRSDASPQRALAGLTGLIDVVVDGVNLTARVGEGPAMDFLVDLSLGLTSMLSSSRPRTTVPLHTESDVWELGIEAAGESVLLSVFRQAPVVSVAVFERCVLIAELRDALRSSIENALLTQRGMPSSTTLGLKAALRELADLPASEPAHPAHRVPFKLASMRRGFRVGMEGLLRRAPESVTVDPHLERADLHSVLLEGGLSFHYGQSELELTGSQLFVDAERLLLLTEEAVTSLIHARPTFRRVELSRARVSMRRGPGRDPVELKVDPIGGGRAFFAVLDTELLVRVSCELMLKLSRVMCKNDPQQSNNLRLTRTVKLTNDLLAQLARPAPDECVTNHQPESYRRFVPKTRRASGVWDHGAKMRFLPRWVATVPGIDLKSTFLCGDRLIVGGSNETACLHRTTGEVVWKKELRAAANVVTPSGLVRIEPDGRLLCHHLDSGEVRFGLKVKPRAHGGATGSVLYGPGLPKLLALTEGDRQVSGIDLVSGEVRWRYTAKRPAPYRVRRAGRLLIVGGGDPLLVAIDGVNGDVVWSLSSRLPFTGEVAVDHDSACVLSGAPGGSWLLHRLNPWSGERAWEVELDERPWGRAPLLTPSAIVVPTSDEDGAGCVAFDRKTGRKLWEQAPGLVNGMSAWLAVDDCILINCARGLLMGLDAADGSVRFNHVFSSACEADQPRRLEPVLRSGALFVPQQSVHVVRPLNGDLLGTLPSDLVPDLIRVDERCDVYVAEESGHVAAFGAAPKLAVVR